jgi:hypothetical protein
LLQALEAGKVLVFQNLKFSLLDSEASLLNPILLAPKTRNISLTKEGLLKGAIGDAATLNAVQKMVSRYSSQCRGLIEGLFPAYAPHLNYAPTSYRPAAVESRAQSWRADDKRLHIDAFPSRPNRGERILRVFTNINPNGQSRVWRVGEPFETVAAQFLPKVKPYVSWQAKALRMLGVTKTLRSEYDHLMLQLHDGMKADIGYQKSANQEQVLFPPGSTWICFSDQTSHAAMSGQFMLEQTIHIAAENQVNTEGSPLAILTRLKNRKLV